MPGSHGDGAHGRVTFISPGSGAVKERFFKELPLKIDAKE
jgi:ribosomal protein L35AE/L33A